MNRIPRLISPMRTIKFTAFATAAYITYRLADPDPPDPPDKDLKRILPLLDPIPPWAFTRNFFYPPSKDAFWNFASLVTMTTIGLISKTFLAICTTTTVFGLDAFLTILNSPLRDRP